MGVLEIYKNLKMPSFNAESYFVTTNEYFERKLLLDAPQKERRFKASNTAKKGSSSIFYVDFLCKENGAIHYP